MMPAISLTPLPPLPPFQLLPEPDLNFDALIGGVAALPAPVTQAQPAPLPDSQAPDAPVPDETMLRALGITPIRPKPPEPARIPEAPHLALNCDCTPDLTSDVLTSSEEAPAEEQALPEAREESVPAVPAALPLPLPPLALPAGQVPLEKTAALTPVLQSAPTPQLVKPERANLPAPTPKPALTPEKRAATAETEAVRNEPETPAAAAILKDMPAVIAVPPKLDQAEDVVRASPQPNLSAPAADPLRFVVERQLDLARDSRWLDALTRDIIAVADAPDRLSFRLSPPQLGRLDVDISTSESGLSLRMNTGSEAATQIITAAQPRLIDELKNQGVRVAEAQVSTGGGQSQGQSQQHQQRSADQMIEYARARFDRAGETKVTRPKGRFA